MIRQTPTQSRITEYLAVVFDHFTYDLGSADQYDHSLGSRDRRIQQISRHQHRRAGIHRNDYNRIFASLALMDGYGVGKLEIIEQIEGIVNESVVKAYTHKRPLVVDALYDSDISVEDADAA